MIVNSCVAFDTVDSLTLLLNLKETVQSLWKMLINVARSIIEEKKWLGGVLASTASSHL